MDRHAGDGLGYPGTGGGRCTQMMLNGADGADGASKNARTVQSASKGAE
jgi:hypothetical protein